MSKLPEIRLDDLDSWDTQSEAVGKASSSRRSMRRGNTSSSSELSRKKDSKAEEPAYDDTKSEMGTSKSEKRKSARMSRKIEEPPAPEPEEKKKPKSIKVTTATPDISKAAASPSKAAALSVGGALGKNIASSFASPLFGRGDKDKKYVPRLPIPKILLVASELSVAALAALFLAFFLIVSTVHLPILCSL